MKYRDEVPMSIQNSKACTRSSAPTTLYTKRLTYCIGIAIAIYDTENRPKQVALLHSNSEHSKHDDMQGVFKRLQLKREGIKHVLVTICQRQGVSDTSYPDEENPDLISTMSCIKAYFDENTRITGRCLMSASGYFEICSDTGQVSAEDPEGAPSQRSIREKTQYMAACFQDLLHNYLSHISGFSIDDVRAGPHKNQLAQEKLKSMPSTDHEANFFKKLTLAIESFLTLLRSGQTIKPETLHKADSMLKSIVEEYRSINTDYAAAFRKGYQDYLSLRESAFTDDMSDELGVSASAATRTP